MKSRLIYLLITMLLLATTVISGCWEYWHHTT